MPDHSLCTPKSGAISTSAGDPMGWNLTQEEPKTSMVITVTSAVNANLYIQEAANVAELASPVAALPHRFIEPLVANTTKRVVIPRDPSLPVGKAWVADGTGDYSMTGGRKVRS